MIRRESQIAWPSITRTGTRRWPVSASISDRRERRCGTVTCSKASRSRASARAILPQGQSQFVGVVQRYSVGIALDDRTPSTDSRSPQQVAGGTQRERLARPGRRSPLAVAFAVPGDRRLEAVLVR